MALYITSLNSGSNGNCYYVGNSTEAVLIDAGISCRETEKRMKRLGLAMSSVKAIFVSHEHADHINGIRVLSKKHQLPVYITSATLRSAGFIVEKSLIRYFNADNPVTIGGLSVVAGGGGEAGGGEVCEDERSVGRKRGEVAEGGLQGNC